VGCARQLHYAPAIIGECLRQQGSPEIVGDSLGFMVLISAAAGQVCPESLMVKLMKLFAEPGGLQHSGRSQ
jgi:hypothetical protein